MSAFAVKLIDSLAPNGFWWGGIYHDMETATKACGRQRGGCEIVEVAVVVASDNDGPLKHWGYADDDECHGDTIDDYVNSRLYGDADDPFKAGYEFNVDHGFVRTEKWRVVSVDPIKCERIDAPADNAIGDLFA